MMTDYYIARGCDCRKSYLAWSNQDEFKNSEMIFNTTGGIAANNLMVCLVWIGVI